MCDGPPGFHRPGPVLCDSLVECRNCEIFVDVNLINLVEDCRNQQKIAESCRFLLEMI